MPQRGANCTLSAPGHGTWQIRATQIGYLYEVLGEESHARFGKTFYPRARVSSDFMVTAVFGHDEGEYRAFGEWMRAFGIKAAVPDSQTRYMRVIYPPRGFDLQGFYQRGVSFGDRVGRVGFSMSLYFVGAHQESAFVDDPTWQISSFLGPHDSPYYPGGAQRAGLSIEETLFGGPVGQQQLTDDASSIVARRDR